MTPAEFKAWLEGLSEGIDKAPTEAQWAKIQQKLKQTDATVGPFRAGFAHTQGQEIAASLQSGQSPNLYASFRDYR